MQEPADCCQTPIALPTEIDALDYNMCHKYRGFCLVLNHETFENKGRTRYLTKRNGSDVDADSLLKVFAKLGFTVCIRKDCTIAQVREVLNTVASIDHSELDCFVCIVLTHGEHGHLYSKDDRYVIDLLFNNFLGNKCPTLVGKPKLFFIQACQGERLDNGVLVSMDTVDDLEYFKIPTYADFMIAYSTLPGFYSFRNTEKGSWFIRALVDVLNQYHESFDLLTMMTIVCHRVAYYFSSNAADPQQSGKKQVPCITSMLTRRVYFSRAIADVNL